MSTMAQLELVALSDTQLCVGAKAREESTGWPFISRAMSVLDITEVKKKCVQVTGFPVLAVLSL